MNEGFKSINKCEFSEPFKKFSQYLELAKKMPNIVEPTAMCLSSVDERGFPSSRIVLLKSFDEKGFCFFTNLTSRKGYEISKNPMVALCFYWERLLADELGAVQVRIFGKVEKVSAKEADAYFLSRPRGSQIGAWASKQSCEMANREEFKERVEKITADFDGQEVPRPPFWSGFRVVPSEIEFWQEGNFRMHHRAFYKIDKLHNGWELSILYP